MIPITRLELFLNGIISGSPVPEPITRIETMLNDIKNGDVVSLTPITRGERYLAKISGANVEIPNPITRVETYLAKIAGIQIETPSPIVRIEHWLNAWASGEDPLGTFTGAIARFFSRASKPIVKLEAAFTPIQNLNGQEAPWPPGGGKNILPYPYSAASGTYNDVAITVNNDGTVNLSGTASATVFFNLRSIAGKFTLKAGSYVVSGQANGSIIVVGRAADNIAIGSTNINNGQFAISEDTEVFAFIQINSGNSVNGTAEPMIRLSSVSDATFAPYSNICPISGHTGCEVVRNGVNQWDEEVENGYINADGSYGTNANALRSKNFCPCVGGETYYFVKPSDYPTTPNLCWYDSEQNFISRSTTAQFPAIPAPSNARYFKVSMWAYGSTYNNDISINYPSTDHDYHAYVGTTVTVNFGQTVYGGQLTVNEDGSGQIDVDRAYKAFSDLTGWKYRSNQFDVSIADGKPQSEAGKPSAFITDTYETKLSGASGSYPNDTCAWQGTSANQVLLLRVRELSFTSVSAFLADRGNAHICYELATPITIPLTPGQIQTLVGENVVWVEGSSGDITVQAFGTEIT